MVDYPLPDIGAQLEQGFSVPIVLTCFLVNLIFCLVIYVTCNSYFVPKYGLHVSHTLRILCFASGFYIICTCQYK